MPSTDPPQQRSSLLLPKLGSLAFAAACYGIIEWASSFHILSKSLPLPSSLSIPLAWIFEHQIWQFGIGIIGITILSRGNLWSYGINSSDIRLSMSILLRFYAAAVVIMIGFVVMPLFTTGTQPAYLAKAGRVDMAVWILYQWMATAVADEILFHGLFQTLLLKYWKKKIRIRSYEFPAVILFTAVAFAAGRTNVPVYGGHVVEYLLALVMGLYGGIVYYRTKSLLTPMLSQAFFYGLPFVIRFATTAILAR